MEEPSGDCPVRLMGAHRRPKDQQFLNGRGEETKEKDRHIDTDQRQRDVGAGPSYLPSENRPGRSYLPGCFSHTVHTLHADGGLPLTLRAHGTFAPLAAHVGNPFRVARAGGRGLGIRGPCDRAPVIVLIPLPRTSRARSWRVVPHVLFDDLNRVDDDVVHRAILRTRGGVPDRVDDVD